GSSASWQDEGGRGSRSSFGIDRSDESSRGDYNANYVRHSPGDLSHDSVGSSRRQSSVGIRWHEESFRDEFPESGLSARTVGLQRQQFHGRLRDAGKPIGPRNVPDV